ncbi:MAG TPA: hypothetical protein VKT22_09630 [Steroidobacteraceae bacterium]|nr:hypothetical protein [Steroidobacteraceae bacterium]
MTAFISPTNSTTVRSLILTFSLANAVLWSSAAGGASEIVVDTPPPPPRVETTPAHRDGYVWSPGYWEWNGRFFRWRSGTFVSERRGRWIADHWDSIDNRWHFVAGHWEH